MYAIGWQHFPNTVVILVIGLTLICLISGEKILQKKFFGTFILGMVLIYYWGVFFGEKINYIGPKMDQECLTIRQSISAPKF